MKLFWGTILRVLDWLVYIRDKKLVANLGKYHKGLFMRKGKGYLIVIKPVKIALTILNPLLFNLHHWRDLVTTKLMLYYMSRPIVDEISGMEIK